jgi:hypothetical protein
MSRGTGDGDDAEALRASYATLGPIPVKGRAETVEVFELVGASAVRRRLQAEAARSLARFVGRQKKLEALQQALGRAEGGHGQVVAGAEEPNVHVEDGDELRTIRAKVMGQVLTLDEALQETIPALLSLLEFPADSPFLKLDPAQRR